jgi:hypothetical protein
MPVPNIQIVIEADETGVTAALDQIKERAAALPPTFQQVGSAGDNASSQIVSGFEHSRESARLLREETGIFLPRALQGLIAQSQILGPLLSAAFSGLAVVGFGEIMLSVGKRVLGVAEEISGAKERMKEMEEATLALGKAEHDLAEATKTYVEQLRYAGLEGSKLNEAEVADAHIQVATFQAKVAGLQALRVAVEQTSHETIETWKGDAETGSGVWVQEMSKAAKDAQVQLKSIDTEIAVFQTAVAKSNTELLKAEEVLNKVYGEETRQQIRATTEAEKQLEKQREENDKARQKGMEQLDKQLVDDMEAQKKADDYWATQKSENRKKAMAEIDAEMMVNIEADQKVAEEGRKSAEKYAQEWTRARDTMANSLNSFFSELTSGNIGQAFLRQFEKLVSQMVATWLMGIQGMGNAVTRGGGIFGDLLGFASGGGPLFGGRSFFGSGATAAGGALSGISGGGFDSSIFGSPGGGGFTGPEASMLGLPLSAGTGGGALAGILPAGATAFGSGISGAGGAASGIAGGGGLLSGIESLLPLGALAGGTALLAKGGIAGMLGAGLTGFGAGSIAGSLIGSLGGITPILGAIAPFLGPIGAGIGLIAGLISLFTGGGKLKEQQSQVANQEELALSNLENAFGLHQIDYNSAIAQAEQIRQSFTQQQEQLQQGGSVGRVDPQVNRAEANIRGLEQVRQNALAAAQTFGPAQFDRGGYVDPSLAGVAPGFRAAMHFAMGGAVPAIVHAGEYVLNAGAVSNIGRGTLDRWNSGESGGTHIHLNISALDGKSVEELFMPGGEAFRGLTRNIRRAVFEGRL